jgi:hypothetical protein
MPWDWTLAAVGVTGMYLAGRKLWWGWLVNLSNEALWVAYAVATNQPGFLLMAAGYATVYANNAHNWRKQQRRNQ